MACKLLITGVNGYLGLHMAIAGLRQGYAIRGTVRSAEKSDLCVKYLSSLLTQEQLIKFETVNADIANPLGWDQAIRGCDAIMHLASPVCPVQHRDRKLMIKQVRDGIRHIFEAALRQKVTRIIYTSSVAASMFGQGGFKCNYNEEDWSNPEGKPHTDYTLSKTLAEIEAWDFVQQYSELQLTTLLPGLILGPINNKLSVSTELVLGLVNGAFSKGVINRDFPIIDVRDVVLAHFKSLKNHLSIGQRIMLAGDCLTMREMAKALITVDSTFNARINTNEMPRWQLNLLRFFSKPLRQLAMEAEVDRTFCREKATKLLGIRPRDPRESIIATAKDLIRLGLVST